MEHGLGIIQSVRSVRSGNNTDVIGRAGQQVGTV